MYYKSHILPSFLCYFTWSNTGTALSWFTSYLMGREYWISELQIYCSPTQGSALSPLMLLPDILQFLIICMILCLVNINIGLQQLMDKIIDNDSHYRLVGSAHSVHPTSASCAKLQHWITHFYGQNVSKNCGGNRMRCCERTRLRDPSCPKHDHSLF